MDNKFNDRQESVLQKITMFNPSALLDVRSWVISVSEYKIEVAGFDLEPPDSDKKLLRKFVFSTEPSVLGVDIIRKYGLCQIIEKKGFMFKDEFTGWRYVFGRLIDRRIGEDKAKKIFKDFQDEAWLVNDGMCSVVLQEVEEEERRNYFKNLAKQRVSECSENSSLEIESLAELEATCEKSNENQKIVKDVETRNVNNFANADEDGAVIEESSDKYEGCRHQAEDDIIKESPAVESEQNNPGFTQSQEQMAFVAEMDEWERRNLPSLLFGKLL